MSEDHLVRHCAPTLAGLKTASLFTCAVSTRASLHCAIRQMNKRLQSKGLRIIPLQYSGKKALIYIYRPKKLFADLTGTDAAQLLRQHGYDPVSCEKCIVHLIRRLRQQGDFPHEIGLFLGYPVADVQGFIENQACNCKCAGCWKVYGDEENAKKKFAQYKKCTRVYCDRWAKGAKIERLAVAV